MTHWPSLAPRHAIKWYLNLSMLCFSLSTIGIASRATWWRTVREKRATWILYIFFDPLVRENNSLFCNFRGIFGCYSHCHWIVAALGMGLPGSKGGKKENREFIQLSLSCRGLPSTGVRMRNFLVPCLTAHSAQLWASYSFNVSYGRKNKPGNSLPIQLDLKFCFCI